MSGLGFPSNVNVPGGLGGVAGSGLATQGSSAGQIFTTRALPNSRFALYTLAIFSPQDMGTPVRTYTFPISPSNVIKEFSALTNIYDVAGPVNQQGVTRIADVYGSTPVTYTIKGTTGWQYHSTDGYSFTGVGSIIELQNALNSYAQLNASQIQNGSNQLYIMEFYDYFTGAFWQVVPMGPQRIEQTSERPLLFEYSLRLAGIKDLSGGPSTQQTDNLPVNALAGSTTSLGNTISTNVATALGEYEPMTLGV